MFTMKPIATVKSPFSDITQIPKGLGARHKAEGIIQLNVELEEGLKDIEGFSHLYILWVFDRINSVELCAHPPCDDRSHGVFATRSPKRPNAIGLTVVELIKRDGLDLHVRGVDMLDGTPVLDIKPYLSGIPMDQLRRGWLAEVEASQSGTKS